MKLRKVQSIKHSPGKQFSVNFDIYDDPVFDALEMIGRPAILELILAITKDENVGYHHRCLYILRSTLGGKRRLNDVLDKDIQSTNDKDAVRRIIQAKEIMVSFEELHEPLY